MNGIERYRTGTRTANSLNLLAGVWEIMAPFILIYYTNAAVTNNIVVGALVAVIAAIRLYNPGREYAWLSWVNVALGVWLIMSPFVLGYTSNYAIWNDIIMGTIIAVLALWAALRR